MYQTLIVVTGTNGRTGSFVYNYDPAELFQALKERERAGLIASFSIISEHPHVMAA